MPHPPEMVALLVGYYMPPASVCEWNVPLKMISWIERRKNGEELAFFAMKDRPQEREGSVTESVL